MNKAQLIVNLFKRVILSTNKIEIGFIRLVKNDILII